MTESEIILKNKIVAADIVFMSFPKSGRTWVRFFIAKYFEIKYNIPFDLELSQIPCKLLFTHNFFDIYQDTTNVPEILFPRELSLKKIVIMVRDPRDVSISYFYHKTLRENIPGKTIDDFVLSPTYGTERQSIFVSQLLDLYEHHTNRKMVLIYENLLQHPDYFFEGLLNFMDIELDAEILQRAIDESCFEAMRKFELNLVNKNLPLDYLVRLGTNNYENDSNILKVRNGKRNTYLTELKPKTIHSINSGITHTLLRRMNYEYEPEG